MKIEKLDILSHLLSWFRIGNRLVAFDVGVIGGHLTMESDSVDHGESESVEKLPPITGSSKGTSV